MIQLGNSKAVCTLPLYHKCDFHFIWQCPERIVTMVGWKSRTCLRQIYCCCLQSTKTSLSQTGFIDCTCTNENAVIEIFAMASYIFTRVISQLVMAIGDSRDLHKQSVYNIMLFARLFKAHFLDCSA